VGCCDGGDELSGFITTNGTVHITFPFYLPSKTELLNFQYRHTQCYKSRFTEKPGIKTTYLLSIALKNCSKCLPFCSIHLRQRSATQLTMVVHKFLSSYMISNCASKIVRRCSKSFGLWEKTLFFIMPHTKKLYGMRSHDWRGGGSQLYHALQSTQESCY
jgi:hypothetical protein